MQFLPRGAAFPILAIAMLVLARQESAGQESFAGAPVELGRKLAALVAEQYPWYPELPPAWRQSLLGCIFTKGNYDIKVESDAGATAIDPAVRFMGELGRISAGDVAAIEKFCPKTIAEVRKHVP